VSLIENQRKHAEFAALGTELVMNSLVVMGDYAGARDLAQDLARSLDKEKKINALYVLASLDSYSSEYSDISNQAKDQLRTSGADEGMLVALGIQPQESADLAQESAESEGDLSISNYPNPFNPSTTISFTIPTDGQVRLRVYDMLGRVVQDLVNETRTAGSHRVIFEGSSLPSGVYFYKLEFGGKTMSRKFILAK
jgi:hypothetical protein